MKDDWSRSVQRFRKWYKAVHCGKNAPKVLWVRELTKAGKLHYHAVINGEYPGKWDALGIWPHGMSQVKKGEGDTCTAYLLKYASKLDSKLTADFKHWRLYGFVGLSQEQRRTISYQMLPEWIRSTFPLEKIKSPSARLLHDGRKLQSGWTYGGASFAAGLPRGFDSIVYVGYCVLPPWLVERVGGGWEREAHPPRPGLVTLNQHLFKD
ncbi:MAG: hypothetical protein H7835_19175 [Magnetococcus sp. XQGC-1]